jgi:hypothetical protein
MKRLAFALGILTVSFCVAPPALADFAVVRFNSGFCRIWTDTAFGPQDGQFVVFRMHHVSSTASIPGSRLSELCIGLSRGMSAEQTNSRLTMPAGCSAIFCGQPAARLELENAPPPRGLLIGRPQVQL